MADETADLRTLVIGTPEKVQIVDRKGNKHTLHPLTLADLIDYEDHVGGSLFGADLSRITLKNIAYLVYLSLRKEGTSDSDVEAGRYNLTEKQMLSFFDMSFFQKSGDVFLDLMRISGIDLNPQKANQKQDASAKVQA